MFFYLIESLCTYASAVIIMYLFIQQQHQINRLKGSIGRIDLELEERDQERVVRKLRKRILKLEKLHIEDNMDILQANAEKLRDVLDESRRLLEQRIIHLEDNILPELHREQTDMQNEMRNCIASIQYRMNKQLLTSIPDRQLSPEIVFTENGLPVQIHDFTRTPHTPLHSPNAQRCNSDGWNAWRLTDDDDNVTIADDMEYFDH